MSRKWKRRSFVLAAAAGLVLACAPHGFCNGYSRIAKIVAKSALRAGMQTVAVFPFVDIKSRSSVNGMIIAERLITELVRIGRVKVVERTLLDRVMREQGLESTGIISSAITREIGQLLGVDGIVTGTILTLGNGIAEINTRLLDAQTAEVVTAYRAKLKDDWGGAWDSWEWVKPPEFELESDLPKDFLGEDGSPGFGFGASNEECSDWQKRNDNLNREILVLRAKYWAGKLKEKDFSAARLRSNPGSEISDEWLRRQFYDLVKAFYRQTPPVQMSPSEIETVHRTERKIRDLTNRCRSAR